MVRATPHPLPSLSLAVGAIALTAGVATIGLRHRPQTAPDADARAIAQASLEAAWATDAATGALLIDLVEPAEGEGGSERALAAYADSLRAQGLSVEAAGPYSEGEHLLRVHGSPSALRALERQAALEPLVEGVEAEILYALPDALAVVAEDASSSDPGVLKPNRPRVQPNDPMFRLQWHMEAIHAPEAWAITRGAGAVVAVIDTGVAYKDFEHKNVRGKAVPDLAGITFVDGQTFIDNSLPDGLDDHAHGTHVAGTIAQATNNGIGVTGVAHHAKIMPLKVLGGDGRGSVAGIANAIRWAADHDADVINMSLGGPLPSRVMAKAVAYARSKGVVVVCAAGNERRSRVSYPAGYEGAFAVAATDFSGKRAFYSNWGKDLDISAPGGDTRTDENGDGHPDGVLQNTIKIQDPSGSDYSWFMGTSMAAPHAAGVAALVMSMGVDNPDEVERILKTTAKHPHGKTWDAEYGAGLIDAEAAVKAAHRGAYLPERLWLLGALGLLFGGWFARSQDDGPRARTLTDPRSPVGAATAAVVAVLVMGLVSLPLPYALALTLGGLGSGVWLSPLVPAALAVGLVHRAWLRPVLMGISAGWAAIAAHGALALPTLLTALPGGPAVDRAFLAISAVACVALAARVWVLPTKPDASV